MRILTLQSFFLVILIVQNCSCGQQQKLSTKEEIPDNNLVLSYDKKPTNIMIEEMTYGPITHQLICVLKNNDTQPVDKDELVTIFWEIDPQQAQILNLENKPITSFSYKPGSLEPQQSFSLPIGTLKFDNFPKVTIKSWVTVQEGSQTSKSGELMRTYQSASQNIQQLKLELVSAGPLSLSNQDKNISFQVMQEGQPLDHDSLQVKVLTTPGKAVIKTQQGNSITSIDKPSLNQPITLQLEANGEQQVQITLQLYYKGAAMGQPILYNYLSTQEKSTSTQVETKPTSAQTQPKPTSTPEKEKSTSAQLETKLGSAQEKAKSPQEKEEAPIYFKYAQEDFQNTLNNLKNKFNNAQEYNKEDVSTYPEGSIIFWFESVGARLNHYLPGNIEKIINKSKANVIFIRIHDEDSKGYDDDTMDKEFTTLSRKGQKCVVIKGKRKISISNTGVDVSYTIQLIDEAGLEKEIRNAVFSIRNN